MNIKHILSVLLCICMAVVSTAARTESYVTYYHNDLLGSPVAATDEGGNLLWRESYKPFGEKIINDDSGNNVGYTGHQFDKTTELVYMQARYYDPVIGRFMGVDPVGFVESNPMSFNRYAYANNNPYRYVDPDGNIPVETVWDIANVGIGVVSFSANVAIGNYWGATLDAVGVVADSVATVVPYVPGGAGTAIKGYRATQKLKAAANKVDNVLALPKPDMVKHHIFNVFRGKNPNSQKYRDFFKKHGIKLDDHTVELTVNEHKLVHQAGNNWTTQWKRWIDENPNATTKEVYQQAGRMMDIYGIGHKPIIKY